MDTAQGMGFGSRGHAEGPAATMGVWQDNAIEKEGLLSSAPPVLALNIRDRFERVK
jgi:hypothetical protein